MNFTGHKKLTDEEYKENYEKLFYACPRPSEYKSEEYWNKVRERQRHFFEEQEKTLSIPLLPGENWVEHPKYKTYKVSNLGRVMINDVIQKQRDDPDGKLGYLVLEKYTMVLVYQLVADVFLDRKEGEGLAVHHIDNNGYDCSEDNLIMLTERQHNAIHRNEMEVF